MKSVLRIAAALAACSAPLATAHASSLESGVLDEINWVRAHPREYADELRDYRRYFEGRILYLPGDPDGIATQEGRRAVDEAIDFLERQSPLPPLGPGSVLARAARDHAADQGPSGAVGHVSRDGAGPGERVRRRGGGIYVGETISYGPSDPEAVVRQFVVDDGVPGRGHRALIFDRGFRFAGVGCGEHRRYRFMCVVDYSATPDGEAALPAARRGARSSRR